jgi:NaMN:DMB phosphoribosyltransferase
MLIDRSVLEARSAFINPVANSASISVAIVDLDLDDLSCASSCIQLALGLSAQLARDLHHAKSGAAFSVISRLLLLARARSEKCGIPELCVNFVQLYDSL